jgi:glycerate kinase
MSRMRGNGWSRVRALACPASLKNVLSADAAAAALAAGLREGGADAVELPLADGGEGTAAVLGSALGGEWRDADVHDAFGHPRVGRWLLLPDGAAVVEAAAAVPLDPSRLDPLAASSRGFGELVVAALGERPASLLLCLGGTATMDGGAGFLEVVRDLPVPARVACDVRATLAEAPRLFGPQKGAGPADVLELERRIAARDGLALFRQEPYSGAAGGLGAALASLGATLEPGARIVLDTVGFDPSGYDLVVTGEGRVDATTRLGKAPGEAVRRAAGTRCVVFGGVVDAPLPGVETVALSGDPSRARADLVALGRDLALKR